MNKQGVIQSVVVFAVLLLGLIIMSPIILKVGTTILGTTATKLSAVDTTNRSSNEVNFVKGQITGTMDWIVMFLVIINILLLLLSSFLIDVHPAFVIIYILLAFVMVITIPYASATAEKIYGMSDFSVGSNNVIQYIPMTEFMLNNFGVVLVGVLFLSGIIMYAKFRFNSGGGGIGY